MSASLLPTTARLADTTNARQAGQPTPHKESPRHPHPKGFFHLVVFSCLPSEKQVPMKNPPVRHIFPVDAPGPVVSLGPPMKTLSLILIITSISMFATAHPGGLDAKGGHVDSKTGKYHTHAKSPAKADPKAPAKGAKKK